jgi:hypothetical protein
VPAALVVKGQRRLIVNFIIAASIYALESAQPYCRVGHFSTDFLFASLTEFYTQFLPILNICLRLRKFVREDQESRNGIGMPKAGKGCFRFMLAKLRSDD